MESRAGVKAIVIHEPGGAGQLALEDVPDPTPGPGELLVSIEAAGLNYIDIYHRSGLNPMSFPLIPGLEGAGTIIDVGEDVDGFSSGGRVGWANVIGSYAEMSVVPAERAIPIPDSVDVPATAALLLQGMTAHYLATDTYPLTGGDRCLVHAGAGGVGLLLTQIAKLRGAEVITTVGSDEKAELSRAAGADHVIVYTRDDFKTAVEAILGPNQIDVVYDGVGAATFDKGLDLLRPRGTMVTFGSASGQPPDVSPRDLAVKGSIFLTRPAMAHHLRTREEMLARAHDLFRWVESGQLEVRIGAEYALADAAEAHRALESRTTSGKVLIIP